MRNQHTIILILFLFSLPIILSSCDEKAPNMRLTSTERVRVDTLFTEKVKDLRIELDSLCDLNYDARVKTAVDSIIKIRKRRRNSSAK